MANNNLSRFAIVGRPNVGKSTLFNYLVGSRKSLVKNESGVTRDVMFEEAEIWGKSFEIVDTGGLTDSTDHFSELIKTQVRSIIKKTNLILFVTDGRAGLLPEDKDILKLIQKSGVPFLVIINKVDNINELEEAKTDFYEIGNELISLSLERRIGCDLLLEWIYKNTKDIQPIELDDCIKLVCIGKPNVGKSSLVNFLAKEDRLIVSDIAGTTTDSVDVRVNYDDTEYEFLDTAGLRKNNDKTGLEVLSGFKSMNAIKRCNIALLLVDGSEGTSEQDARIVQKCVEMHKPIILVANKIDIAERTIEEFRSSFKKKFAEDFHFINDLPICFISAKTGKGIKALFERINHINSKLNFRISTSDLNEFFTDVIRLAPSPVRGTKSVKFYYLTQTRQIPPSFLCFANYPEAVTPSYRRFLMKNIKKKWDLLGIPIRLFVMKRKR